MATRGGKLSDSEISEIAFVYPASTIEEIALLYMGFDSDFIKNIKEQHGIENRRNTSRDIIQSWANKNDGDDQKEVSVYSNYKISTYPHLTWRVHHEH